MLDELLTHPFQRPESNLTLRFIDPLCLRLLEALRALQAWPLQTSKALFGTEDDLRRTRETVKGLVSRSHVANELWLLDLTVVDGFRASQAAELPGAVDERPVLTLARQGPVYSDLLESGAASKIPIALCDGNLHIVQVRDDNASLSRAHTELIHAWQEASLCIQELRVKAFHQALLSHLQRWGTREPPKGKAAWLHPNNMCTNLYVDVKAMLAQAEFAYFSAYGMAYALTHAFRDLKPPPALMAVNNTAVFLASMIRLIVEGDLTVVDQLGPFMNLREPRYGSLPNFGGRGIWLVEEVVATGHEADLGTLFISLRGGVPSGVVCLFYLEAGHPLSASAKQEFAPLCTPSETIKYRYFSRGVCEGDVEPL